jgi:hypothetical protein
MANVVNRSQVRLCGVLHSRSGTGVSFLLAPQFPSSILISATASYSVITTRNMYNENVVK